MVSTVPIRFMVVGILLFCLGLICVHEHLRHTALRYALCRKQEELRQTLMENRELQIQKCALLCPDQLLRKAKGYALTFDNMSEKNIVHASLQSPGLARRDSRSPLVREGR